VETRDFFKQLFTIEELRVLLQSLKLTPREVVATKSPSYKKMGLGKRTVSDAELLSLMVQEPRLLRRPLVIVDGKPVIGFDKEKLGEVLKQ
jgi:arsenate reductase (glutaredoxin)